MGNLSQNLDSYTTINIYTVQMFAIYKFWQNMPLPGNFWRLYSHNSDGAMLIDKGQKVELSPKSIYLIRANSDLLGTCNDINLEQLYIHFTVNLFLGNCKKQYFEIPLDNCSELILSQLKDAINNQSNYSKIHLFAASLVAYVIKFLPDDIFRDEDFDKRIFKICDIINNNLQLDLSINDLAKKMNFAPNAFIRWFKTHMHKTPYQYLLQARYSQAAYYLENTDIPIKDICAKIGINDRFHFSRCFKDIYGVTPATYRVISKNL